jgi:hypothetical protein
MRWDRLTLTAFGGTAAFLIGAALLFEDARELFAPVIGMIGGLAGLAHANQERLKERIETLERQAARREWREPAKAPWGR